MERASCSHYAPPCSPSSRRARQRRILLTLAANEQNRRKTQENIWWRCLQRYYLRPPSQKSPTGWYFKTRQSRTVLRTAKKPKARFGHGVAKIVRNLGFREPQAPFQASEPLLARSVSTSLRWRARRDDGEH